MKNNNILLALGLTSRCNLKCSYCIARPQHFKPEPDMTPEVVRAAYEKIRRDHPLSFIEILCLGKGEPLLNWSAIEEVNKIMLSDKKTSCAVTTNGTVPEKALLLAKRGWLIQVSYDGVHNSTYRGSSEIVENTIRQLAKRKANFLIRMTVTPDKLPTLRESLLHIRDDLNAKFVCLGPAMPLGRYKEKLQTIAKFDFNSFFKIVLFAQEIGLHPLVSIQEPCSLATRGYYVLPNGEFSICYLEKRAPLDSERNRARRQGCLLINYNRLQEYF
jgi:MoaA/NifB/PqqE/SkfB family radical SAM enzyme